jgi:hypothetical protein
VKLHAGIIKDGERREMAPFVLSTASPIGIGATIWYSLPCLKSPCQLEGEALPTWRFTACRVRSAYQLSGMLEERSSGVACDSGLHLGLLETLGISSPGDTLPTLKKGGPLSYETLLASGKGVFAMLAQ